MLESVVRGCRETLERHEYVHAGRGEDVNKKAQDDVRLNDEYVQEEVSEFHPANRPSKRKEWSWVALM